MKKCYIYTRCASSDVTDKRESITYQEQLCREYAFRKGYKVIDTFKDEGVSGNTTDRKGLAKLLSEVSLNSNSIVLATDIARFARNYRVFNTILDFINKYNCKLETTQGDSTLLFTAIAQLERSMRSQRIKDALRVKKELTRRNNL